MDNMPIDRQVLPFRRRWHVIAEVDLAPLLADHAAVRRMCRSVEALADRLAEVPGPEERFAVADQIERCIRDHVTITSAFLERMFAGEDCGSAWKKDPGSGVIGVEKGPLIPVV